VGAVRTITIGTRITDTGNQDRVTDAARANSTARDPKPDNNSATATTMVLKAPTAMVAKPVILQGLLPLIVVIPEISAVLKRTDTGAPVTGRLLTFTTNSGSVLCTARTDASGFAACRQLRVTLGALLSLSYRVTFAEDGRYLGSKATGPLIRIS
jgi:hypothetical protein